ncbi:hypothetical protein ZHAS_00019980 [Anopheles sinensis]|uniref:Uncharacterized protein n=1 Tax=Anopheles sinensis TaxID=74873 RepID=A0A084WNL5_ANOSI|nr:hypothetical protein ZHAS_00019980 [Anopheles sinensis]
MEIDPLSGVVIKRSPHDSVGPDVHRSGPGDGPPRKEVNPPSGNLQAVHRSSIKIVFGANNYRTTMQKILAEAVWSSRVTDDGLRSQRIRFTVPVVSPSNGPPRATPIYYLRDSFPEG